MSNLEPNKLINENIIKKNLLLASLYITGYELLKDSIIEDVKNFFSIGYKPGKGCSLSPDYHSKVKSLDKKNLFRASCLWLAEMGAIEHKDVKDLELIREHRHKIVHELPRILSDENYEIDINLLRKMKNYIRVINNFWAKVDISIINPEIDWNEIDFENIRSGRDLIFDYVMDIVENEIKRKE